MNNLTTRKIVLGMLMVLVLAFSVQSIADALTFGTRRSNDLQTLLPGDDFTISFSVSLDRPQVKDSYKDGRLRNPTRAEIAAGTYTSDDVVYTAPGGEPTGVDRSDAYDYNDEAITINSSPTISNLKIRRGRETFSIAQSSSTASLMETGEGSSELPSGTITLVGVAPTTPGKHIINIQDATPSADLPIGDQNVDPISFTIFVRNFTKSVRSTTITLPMTSKLQYGDDESDEEIHNGTASSIFTLGGGTHVPLTYTVDGPGRVYVRETYTDFSPASEGSRLRTLSTSSAASVRLDMNRGTNKVTVNIPGPQPPVTIIYIYGHAKIDIVDGNQTGATSGRLEEPLVVRVTDASASNRAVSGVAVKFDETETSIGDGMFIPIPGTTVYLDADGSLDDTLGADSYSAEIKSNDIPDAEGAINVQTDSGGEARFYYVLSAMSGIAFDRCYVSK